MKKLWVMFIALASVFVTPASRVIAAGDGVKKTKDICKNAHAILGWSTFEKEEQHEKPWVKVGWVLGRRKYLKRVEDYEAGVAQQASFRQYKVKGHKNGHAYVAHCGYGGTCNEIAGAFFHIYKGIGTPTVYCGPMPKMLIDGKNPEIPIPTDEELAEADDSDDDDMDFGDDDDDDDDDDDVTLRGDAKKKKKKDDLDGEFEDD